MALQADYATVVENRAIHQNIVSHLHLGKSDSRSSRTVSLRQLSFLFIQRSEMFFYRAALSATQ